MLAEDNRTATIELEIAAELGKTLVERNKALEDELNEMRFIYNEKCIELEYLSSQMQTMRKTSNDILSQLEEYEGIIIQKESEVDYLKDNSKHDKNTLQRLAAEVECLRTEIKDNNDSAKMDNANDNDLSDENTDDDDGDDDNFFRNSATLINEKITPTDSISLLSMERLSICENQDDETRKSKDEKDSPEKSNDISDFKSLHDELQVEKKKTNDQITFSTSKESLVEKNTTDDQNNITKKTKSYRNVYSQTDFGYASLDKPYNQLQKESRIAASNPQIVRRMKKRMNPDTINDQTNFSQLKQVSLKPGDSISCFGNSKEPTTITTDDNVKDRKKDPPILLSCTAWNRHSNYEGQNLGKNGTSCLPNWANRHQYKKNNQKPLEGSDTQKSSRVETSPVSLSNSWNTSQSTDNIRVSENESSSESTRTRAGKPTAENVQHHQKFLQENRQAYLDFISRSITYPSNSASIYHDIFKQYKTLISRYETLCQQFQYPSNQATESPSLVLHQRNHPSVNTENLPTQKLPMWNTEKEPWKKKLISSANNPLRGSLLHQQNRPNSLQLPLSPPSSHLVFEESVTPTGTDSMMLNQMNEKNNHPDIWVKLQSQQPSMKKNIKKRQISDDEASNSNPTTLSPKSSTSNSRIEFIVSKAKKRKKITVESFSRKKREDSNKNTDDSQAAVHHTNGTVRKTFLCLSPFKLCLGYSKDNDFENDDHIGNSNEDDVSR